MMETAYSNTHTVMMNQLDFKFTVLIEVLCSA